VTLDDWGVLARTPAGVALSLAIGLVYPLIGWFRFRRLERRPDPLPRREKLALYASIVISQWTLVAACGLVLGGGGRSLADLGQRVGFDLGRTALVSLGLLAGFTLLSWFPTRSLAVAVQGPEDRVDYDPQLRHRGVYPLIQNPEVGEFEFEAFVPKMSRTSPDNSLRAPHVREPEDYVFGDPRNGVSAGLPPQSNPAALDRQTRLGVCPIDAHGPYRRLRPLTRVLRS